MTLFGGFLSNAHLDTAQAETVISLTDPLIFTGLIIGGIFPFVLAGLTVKAARKGVVPFKEEVQRQLREDEGITRGDSEADYAGSVKPLALKTLASLLGPVLLVLVAPFVFGLAIGPKIVTGILLGMIVSGLEFSSSANSSADAWKNAKRVIERGGVADEEGRVQGAESEAYRGAGTGTEVGLGLGKCAGGSIGAGVKVMGMLAVLFGGEFAALHG
jgi:K(+)-stimulated pyrophosphate-energized sodium pump